MAVINQYLQTITFTDPTTANMQLALSAVNDDDNYYEIPTPFPITVFGSQYNSVFVGTNGYISFGSGSSEYPDWVYDIVPDDINDPAILVAAGDDRLRDLWVTNAATSATAETFRLRYVGWYPYSTDEGDPTNLVYDFTFYKNVAGQIDVQIIQQPVSAYDVEQSADDDFVPNLYVCDSETFVAFAPNIAEQGFRINVPNAATNRPYTGTKETGLKGRLYNGYYDGNVDALKASTLEGSTEVKTNFCGAIDTVVPDATWVWTGYLLAPENNYYAFNGSSEHAMTLWFGNSALEQNYSSTNYLASADNYGSFDTRYKKLPWESYTSATRVFTFSTSVTSQMNYLTAGNTLDGYSDDGVGNFTFTIQERDTVTGNITATNDEITTDDDGEYSWLKVRSPEKVVYLQAGQLYPIRVAWGHPANPTGGQLSITFRMMDGYDPVGRYWYDSSASTCNWEGIAWYDSSLTPIEERNNKYATATETGEKRFRRLFALGYV